ncbi:histidine phosphatase family protein, partial [Streptomyces eurythermus]|uniref:histidine phosphatase family protein n=1 Tax=Streptomyces eurythermus TaxID=42237 RepID=UPI00340B1E44
MEPIIYLVRHAESEHNISKDFSHRDPPLTASGVAQASALKTTFPDPGSIAVVFTSPLKRALQTTLAGFSRVLAVQHTDKSNAVDTYAKLVIDVDLQERSDLLCDTGSDRVALEKAFPALDFSALGRDWFVKTDFYSADETSVKLRAEAFRKKLWAIVKSLREGVSRKQRSIVIVTHGVFMKYLSQDMSIDLPKAAWRAFRCAVCATALGP